MDAKIDPATNPILILKNVFGTENSDITPKIDVIPFMAFGEDITWSGPPRSTGGNYSHENVCIIVDYKKNTSYYRLDFMVAEGAYGARFMGPFDTWKSDYLDVTKLDFKQGKTAVVFSNKEIQDIFLNKGSREEHSQKTWCNFTPLILNNQNILLFQFFVGQKFIFTPVEWNPGNQKSEFSCSYTKGGKPIRSADVLLENYPDIKNFMTIKPEYWEGYKKPDKKAESSGEEY